MESGGERGLVVGWGGEGEGIDKRKYNFVKINNNNNKQIKIYKHP